MAAEGHNDAPSAGEYIIHHLTHNQNHHQHGPADFSVINYEEAKFVITLKDGRKYNVTIAPVE